MINSSTIPATSSPLASSPVSIIKTQKMSVTQTYFLAHKARAKLSHEAAMPDHNLRLLVGHANLLDSLMLELADAEREQESWFNQSVRNASAQTSPVDSKKHIQWVDTITEEQEEEDDYDSSSDDDSEMSSDDDIEMNDVQMVSLRRVPSNTFHNKAPASPRLEVVEVDMDDFEEDDYEEEDYPHLTLTRTHSHQSTTSPPPELELDSDESSEDESMPPSPPSTMLPTFEHQRQPQKSSESSMASTTDFFDDSIHYMPRTTTAHNPARLVTAVSVY